MKENNLD
jgi:hypothetical protein